MTRPNPTAFDAAAATYDQAFSDTPLGHRLRRRVWRELTEAFEPGSHILELACGTGIDAVWLAQRGVRVTATDGSARMVEATQANVVRAGVSHSVTVEQRSLQKLIAFEWPSSPPFDGAFSNFGGINTIADWSALAESLARAIRPGGRLVLVPMGPFCPWELLWHLAHGKPGMAIRRFRQPATARIGGETIPIWYPSLRNLKKALDPWFDHQRTLSLGLWLPPSYLGHLVQRSAALLRLLDRVEAATARLTAGWGDHYIASFERTLTPANKSEIRSPSRAGG